MVSTGIGKLETSFCWVVGSFVPPGIIENSVGKMEWSRNVFLFLQPISNYPFHFVYF